MLIVIVNYRTADLVEACLDSLAPQVGAVGARVALVDSQSPDDSVERLRGFIDRRGFQSWVTLMPLEENRGFAAGNNVAIKPALESAQPPGLVVLLNPDTVVHPGALEELSRFMAMNPRAGIAGARMEEPDGSPQRSAFRFHSILGEFEAVVQTRLVTKLLRPWVVAPDVRDESHATDWVCGACLVVRSEVLREIGLLDEGYFLYYDETDLCLRARRAGWEVWYVPTARVIHLGGRSVSASGGQIVPKAVIPAHMLDSRKRFFLKKGGPVYAALADAVWVVGFSMSKLRGLLRPKAGAGASSLADFLRHSVFVTGFRA